MIRNYPQDDPPRQWASYLGVNEDVTALLQEGGNVLSVVVKDGCLTRVELNDQELPGLICDEDRYGAARVNCRGRFGVCNINANCTYFDLTIDGQKPNLVDTRER